MPGGTAHDFRRRSVRMLEDLGISVEFSHHEGGPGQNEIDLRYADALTTADNIMTFRTVIKEVAIEQGVYATFMPKPLAGHPGSGMHTHMSLFEGDANAFYEAGCAVPALEDRPPVHRRPAAPRAGDHRRDQPVRQLLQATLGRRRGAELRHAGATTTARRSCACRCTSPTRASPRASSTARIDSAANPYLAYALLLAAGLKGIEEGYELPPEAEDNVWSLTDAERRALGYTPLPASLDHAIAIMEDSELVAETLGEQVFNYVLLNKRASGRSTARR